MLFKWLLSLVALSAAVVARPIVPDEIVYWQALDSNPEVAAFLHPVEVETFFERDSIATELEVRVAAPLVNATLHLVEGEAEQRDLAERDASGRCSKGTATSNGVRPSANGCGAAWGPTIDLNELDPCCDAHDICWGTCSKSRNACDDALLSCMEAKCDQVSLLRRPACYLVAATAHAAVRSVVGQATFMATTNEHCKCV